jgi:hypothetical protein
MSLSSALQASVQPHDDVSAQQCPFCEQDIPLDKLEEISGRIVAREQEWLTAATSGLREQHARERVQAQTKAKADLEQAQRDAASAVERLSAEAAAREASIRAEATRAAEEAAQVRLEELSRARREETAGLQARIQTAEQAKIAAEERTANVSAELDTIRTESAVAIRKAMEEATAREEAIRAEAAQTAEAAFLERLAAAELAKEAAASAQQTAEAELRGKLAEAGEELQALRGSHANEINQQREALERDKTAALNTERAKSLETQMRLEGQLQDMQRQLQKRTAHEHGEGAELDLYEVVKAAFEDDKIRRVPKGTPGADVIHEVMLNGKLCGKIVYDSKNRNGWKWEYVTKLREDQIAERADHAILSSNKFPAGKSSSTCTNMSSSLVPPAYSCLPRSCATRLSRCMNSASATRPGTTRWRSCTVSSPRRGAASFSTRSRR